MPKDLTFARVKRAKMASWFDPVQLARTGVDIVLSVVFGSRADVRRLQALSAAQPPFRYGEQQELWLDYVSDTGDGFNPTYAVAYAATREALTLQGPKGQPYQTQRGSVLVFGGDEVYPAASRERYQARLVAPYTLALPQASPEPHVFAI